MKIAILGAGKQAQGVLYYLSDAENVERIVVADCDEQAIRDLVRPYLPDPRIDIKKCNAGSVVSLTEVLKGCDTAISCLPYTFNCHATYAAIEAKCNLVDLGGNNDIVKEQFNYNDAARKAGVTIIPDCGLAPGFVSILAKDAISSMPVVDDISIYVGGLPNKQLAKIGSAGYLNYAEVFSTLGLWNEYVMPATVLRDGKIQKIESLTEYETVTICGEKLEAFVTSGGVSTLPASYQKKVKNIEYKTLRYPGHYHVLKALQEINQLSFENLEKLIKPISSDVVFGQVRARGSISPFKISFGRKHHATRIYEFTVRPHYSSDYGITISAMAQATAIPATIIAMMLTSKTLGGSGLECRNGVKTQEEAIGSIQFIKLLKKHIPISIEDHIVQEYEI